MTFLAPMIGQVAGTILNQADSDIVKLLSTPVSHPCFPRMFSRGDLRPNGGAKGDISQVHISLPGMQVASQRADNEEIGRIIRFIYLIADAARQ